MCSLYRKKKKLIRVLELQIGQHVAISIVLTACRTPAPEPLPHVPELCSSLTNYNWRLQLQGLYCGEKNVNFYTRVSVMQDGFDLGWG
jgi:hypothetical protein